MSYLLDTNVCSAHIRRPGGVAHRFIQHSGRLFMPTIVLAELYAGAYILGTPERILVGIDELRKDVDLLNFDENCAEEFGKLRGDGHATAHRANFWDTWRGYSFCSIDGYSLSAYTSYSPEMAHKTSESEVEGARSDIDTDS